MEVTQVGQLNDGVEVIKNPFEAFKLSTGRFAKLEEIRQRRLAVFEVKKTRLMN